MINYFFEKTDHDFPITIIINPKRKMGIHNINEIPPIFIIIGGKFSP